MLNISKHHHWHQAARILTNYTRRTKRSPNASKSTFASITAVIVQTDSDEAICVDCKNSCKCSSEEQIDFIITDNNQLIKNESVSLRF